MEHHNKKKTSLKTLIGLAILVIILALIYGYYRKNDNDGLAVQQTTPTTDQTSQSTTTTSTTTNSQPQPIVTKTYVNTAHQFQFNYTSDWTQTSVFDKGTYTNAIAFVKVNKEDALGKEIGSPATSSSLLKAAQDNALFFRILNSTSINAIISQLYGSGVVVSNVVIANRNVAHVVHSKSSDPANWLGGSTEAYILRNSLGEAVVIEANYSTPEVPASSDLKKSLEMAINSLTLKAQ